MPFLKKTYNLPYLSLMFITVNYELGYKFITRPPPPSPLRHVQVFISVLFFLSRSFLSCMKTIFQDICSSSSVTPESIKNLRNSLITFTPF